MLIFVIPSSYPNNINPQANVFVHEQCAALVKAGCRVAVLDATSFKWRYWLDKTCYKTAVSQKDGAIVYSRHIPSLLKNRLFSLATIQFRFVINRLFEKAVRDCGRPDAIYAHFTYPSGYVSCEIAEKYNIPLMVIEHGGVYMKPTVPGALKKMLRATLEKADTFACVSEAQRKCLYKCAGDAKEIKIINNMIDDRFTYRPLCGNDKFVFFSAGNLYKVKRMDLLIEAFVSAFSKNDNVILKIAGDGAERQTLENLIKDYDRKEQIILTGRLDRDRMLREYEKCNVFALASEHESFGIVYREAMAVGRPVVASDNGGISTGWSDSYGKIVPLDDKEALSEALKFVYENYAQYDLEKISQDCIKRCSSKNVAETIICEMKKIINGDAL